MLLPQTLFTAYTSILQTIFPRSFQETFGDRVCWSLYRLILASRVFLSFQYWNSHLK